MRKSLRTRAPQPEDETFTKLCGTLNRSIGQTSIHSYSTEDGHDLIDLQSCFYYIVIGVSILTLSTIVTFVFGIVATVGYFFQIRKQKYIRQYA